MMKKNYEKNKRLQWQGKIKENRISTLLEKKKDASLSNRGFQNNYWDF